MKEGIEYINRIVWGLPTLLLIASVGILLSIGTRLSQFALFPRALKQFVTQFKRKNDCKIGTSAYTALCTALSATVGTGNLAGVAGAIALGGPGSVFWMWICALLGMIIKYAEATLAVHYSTTNKTGETIGGPMYVICNGLGRKWHWLASIYCFMGVVAAFGVGNATQINAVIGSINGVIRYLGGHETTIGNALLGVGFGILILLILLGGAKKIGSMAEKLVPFASVLYLLFGMGVLLLRARNVPNALVAIVEGAFDPKAVTGGVIGTVLRSVRVGASRGIFTNEAGMGTAGIAHASADVSHPCEQGLMGIMEVFIDTIVICTMTALVILCCGISIPYGSDEGVSLTVCAFSEIYGSWITVPIMFALCCFAVATILGWGLYGVRCAQYLFGDEVWKKFAVVQAIMVVIGALLKTEIVWMLSEVINGLMAVPNLITLILLSPKLIKLTKEYKMLLKNNRSA